MLINNRLFQRFCSAPNILCDVKQQGKLASMVLNRPEQHNSMNVAMFIELKKHFDDIQQNETQVVLLRGTGNNLSSGGDIKSVYLSKYKPSVECPLDTQQRLFYLGYTQAYKWATMKPILVPFFEGITVGGVVGWTAYSQFRIATEKTILAVPELRIGYFLDCGQAYWIHQRKNSIGQFLAYTGHRLRGADVVHSGMADYYVKSDRIDDLHADLKNIIYTSDRESNIQEIKQTIKKYNETTLPQYTLKDKQPLIDQWFSSKTIEELYEKLHTAQSEFSKELIKMLNDQNPLSLVLAAEQLKRSKKQTLQEVFQMDYHLSQKFMQKLDFFEGVKSVLIDKSHKPVWQFPNVRHVDEEEINQYFQNFKAKLPI